MKDKWHYYDTEKPPYAGTYLVLVYEEILDYPSIRVRGMFWDEEEKFGDYSDSVIAWQGIQFPTLPSIEDLAKHGLVSRMFHSLNIDIDETTIW